MNSGGPSNSTGGAPPPPPTVPFKLGVTGSGRIKNYKGLGGTSIRSTQNLRQAAAEAPRVFENELTKWLTYESIFNDDRFTHTDAKRPMGIYNMPIDNLRIILASNIADNPAELDKIRAIFFPNLSPNSLKSLLYAPWDSAAPQTYDEDWKKGQPDNSKKANDDAQTRNKEARARMPYNVINNNYQAKALGTRYDKAAEGKDPLNPSIQLEDQTWEMWQTASRSCFIRPTPPRSPLPVGLDSAMKNGGWVYGDIKLNEAPKAQNQPSADAWDIAVKNECYSVKTGVVYVGREDQGSSKANNLDNKATLEPASIVAAIRTEFMLAMDLFYDKQGKDTQLTFGRKFVKILPEVLTVTCAESEMTEEPEHGKTDRPKVRIAHDGFQLRDLSRLDPKMVYFPALSALWVQGDTNLKTYKPQQNMTAAEFGTWKDYWQKNYAFRIGETKAMLHLLYGFAPLTPNMQNFVFEMDPKDLKVVKRSVLRDVLDFRVHTAWARLVLSADAEKDKNTHTSLVDPTNPLVKVLDPELPERVKKLIIYESCTDSPTEKGVSMLFSSEAGVYAEHNPADIDSSGNILRKQGETLDQFGKLQFYSGLQLNFFAYSAAYRGDTIEKLVGEVKEWKRAYTAMLDWGLAHAMGFITTMNRILSVTLKSGGQDITQQYLTDLKINGIHDKNGKPDPAAPLASQFSLATLRTDINALPDRNGCANIHKKLCAWDFAVSGMIENALYKDPNVRKAIRDLLRG